ncbi:MAG: BatD family protein [Candidatus Omnitrophota bacterium]
MAVTVALFLVSGTVSAQEDKLEVTLEMNNISVGNPVYLNVTFYGGKSIPAPVIPPVDGLRIKYVGPTTKISVVNGRVSQSMTHSYLVIPMEEGDFKIGPVSVRYGGKVYEAEPIVLIAREIPMPSARRTVTRAVTSASSSPRTEPESRPYKGDRIFLTMEVEKEKVYVNEVVPVIIKLYVTDLQLKDIEFPTFEHEGFSAGKQEKPERSFGVVGGVSYDVLVFHRDIFSIKEGEYTLGPARLKCEVVERRQTSRRSPSSRRSIFDDDFFSGMFGYQTYPLELESKALPVKILPFPKAGRPEDFNGAVGDFRMDVKIEHEKVKVGDPILLRMTISGKGNLDTVTAPVISKTEDFKTYEPQVTIKGDKKIYEQVIIPKTDKVKSTPEISFSFLDPETGEYKTVKKGNIPVEVMEQPPEAAVKVISMPGMDKVFYPPEKLGEDIVHIKEKPGRLRPRESFLYQNPLFWLGQVIPVGAFLIFYGVHRKKEKIRTDKGYARFLRAPKQARKGISEAKSHLARGKTEEFYNVIFRTFQEYLANKFNLPLGSVTIQVIDEKLRPAGLDEDILEMLKDVFLKCDMARYATGGLTGEQEARAVLDKVRKVIDYLEKTRL